MNNAQITETLLAWNFWQKEINIGLLRPRYLRAIERFLKTDEVIVLTGVRRSGKSTILLQVLHNLIKEKIPKNNTLYVNFEDPKFYNSLSIDLLDAIWQAYLEYLRPQGKVYLVLDEIQKIKGWEHWVRTKYDQKEDIKILVTGSNAELLSSEFSSVLTGRHFELTISPLDFQEFLEFKGVEIEKDKMWRLKNKKLLLDFSLQYLQLGGFPKIILTDDELLRSELLSQYLNDILTKDIVERHKIKDINKLRNLVLFYSTNFTHKYTFHNIKKYIEFSLSLDSIQRFSAYLKDAFLIDFLPRFSYSLKNQMQTARKVYFVDNGMHNAAAFKFSSDLGKLLENAVFYHLKSQKKEIYYFQERQEVDFVCKKGLKITELINVCYDLEDKQTYLREINALKEAMQYFKLKQAKIITFKEKENNIIKEGDWTISVIPFYQWCLYSSEASIQETH
ncbi:MAG: ATP-binding protein [Candidatus Omnitrophota bacterium]